MALASAALSAAIFSCLAYSAFEASTVSRSVLVSATIWVSFSFKPFRISQFWVNSANEVAPMRKSRNVAEPDRYMLRARVPR